MKCAWHGEPNCPVRKTEEAVREFSHQHDEGVCRKGCYGCFIIAAAAEDTKALVAEREELLLQNQDLQKQLANLSDEHDEDCRIQKVLIRQRDQAEDQLRESNRLNSEMRQRIEWIDCLCHMTAGKCRRCQVVEMFAEKRKSVRERAEELGIDVSRIKPQDPHPPGPYPEEGGLVR